MNCPACGSSRVSARRAFIDVPFDHVLCLEPNCDWRGPASEAIAPVVTMFERVLALLDMDAPLARTAPEAQELHALLEAAPAAIARGTKRFLHAHEPH